MSTLTLPGVDYATFNPARGNNVGILGDSITRQNNDTTATELRQNSHGYFQVANAILGQPFTLIVNGGVSGETTADILSRTDAFIAANPNLDIAIVLAGQNDLPNSIQPAQSITNLLAIYKKFTDLNIRLVCCTVMPTGGEGRSFKTSKSLVNRAIRAYVAGKARASVALSDFMLAWADPATTTGDPLSGATQSDLTHPNTNGATRLGRVLARTLSPWANTYAAATGTQSDTLNYVANSFQSGSNASGSGGFSVVTGFTGVGPDGVGVGKRLGHTGGCAVSKVAHWDAYRSDPMTRLAATFAADYDGIKMFFGGCEDTNTFASGYGRYDRTRANTTAYTVGFRVNPATPNGYSYLCIGAGTSAGSEPSMSTTEGAITGDGTVTWLTQKFPVAGDQFYATVELALSGVTTAKGVSPVLDLTVIDTVGGVLFTVTDYWLDLSGGFGAPLDWVPPTITLRTPIMTLPSFGVNALRYLRATVSAYGIAGGTLTMDVARACIMRVT